MPRPRLSKKTELADLLDRTGMTLAQAAKRLNVSESLIRHVAAGRRNLSPSLRSKMNEVFGLGVSREDVAAAGYATETERNEVALILMSQVNALIHATASEPDRGVTVVTEISAALDSILAKHKLASKVAEVFQSSAKTSQETISRRELDAYFHNLKIPVPPEWVKARGKIPLDEQLVITNTKWPLWNAPRWHVKDIGLVTRGVVFKSKEQITMGKKVVCSLTKERLSARGIQKTR